MRTPTVPPAAFAVLVALAVGCSGSDGRTVVRGKLLDNDKQFSLDESRLKLPAGATAPPPGANPLRVSFIPAEGGEPVPAVVDAAAGTFTVNGPDGKGIKPGKYKVSVTAALGGPGTDYFKGTFSPEKTRIIREVKPGEDVVIDLSKPQG